MPDTVTLSRKQRDQELRRQDFLSAAERLFARNGYHHTTMEDIAHEAQYGTGTIYLYFKTKDLLYEALLERKIAEYIAFMQKRVRHADGHLEKIRTLISAKLEFFERHREFFRIYLAEMTTADTSLRRCVNKRREKMYYEHQSFVTQTLSEAMRAGAIRKVDPNMLATTLTGVINPLLSEWIKERSKKSICELEQFIMDLLFNGLEKTK